MAAANWSRVVNTTTRKYIREVTSNILRNRKMMALLKSKGRITFGWSGTAMDWKVEYKRNTLDGYVDGDTLTFSRKDRWKTAALDWRGYSMTDSMSKQERLENSGTEAIVKTYSVMASNLMKDMEDLFSQEIYINGYLPANARRMHGIESIFGEGAFSGLTSATQAASTTYAGLSTALNAYGGTWTGTWPNGYGSNEYDFWTPLIVNYGASVWSGGASPNNTWANNAHDVLRYAIVKTQKNKSVTGQLDLITVDDEMYRTYLNIIDTKERINVQRNAEASGLVKLGFTSVTNLDGTDITWEYGSPPNVGYGWNMDEMELRSLQSELFEPDGPDYDIASKSWRFSIDFLGNLVFNPRHFCKFESRVA